MLFALDVKQIKARIDLDYVVGPVKAPPSAWKPLTADRPSVKSNWAGHTVTPIICTSF